MGNAETEKRTHGVGRLHEKIYLMEKQHTMAISALKKEIDELKGLLQRSISVAELEKVKCTELERRIVDLESRFQ